MAVKPPLMRNVLHWCMWIGGEGKSKVAVTHLARLGVEVQEPAFWGVCSSLQKKKQPYGCFFGIVYHAICLKFFHLCG